MTVSSRVVVVAGVNLSKTRVRAAATRSRIIRAAFELFCEVGYRATTMQAIADRAGVAVQTMYFVFGRKDTVLQAVHEWSVLGDDPLPPEQQDWFLQAMHAPTGPAALPSILSGCVGINSKVAPMLPVYAAVAGDSAGETYRRATILRRVGMMRLVDALAGKTPLAVGVSADRAADLLFYLTGPECYRELVLVIGWPPADWATWSIRTLARELFDPN